jgi:hypothetical protein
MPPLVEQEAPFENDSLEKTKIMVTGPEGPKTNMTMLARTYNSLLLALAMSAKILDPVFSEDKLTGSCM